MANKKVSTMKITILFGMLLIVIRIWIGCTVEPEQFNWVAAFKDTAHLFMGGLAVAWWIQKHPWQWKLFWVLNLVEIAVAVLSRIQL